MWYYAVWETDVSEECASFFIVEFVVTVMRTPGFAEYVAAFNMPMYETRPTVVNSPLF